MFCEKYYRPRSISEALELLEQYRGRARLIAGGTDLVLQLKEGKKRASVLVDITQIKELNYIEADQGFIRIGALATHSRLAQSSLLLKQARVLAQAAASVGSPQIRNVGTVGGNVVNAQPAADTAVALTALDAVATVLGVDGEREMPVRNLFGGVGQSKIDPTGEMITGFFFKVPPGGLLSSFGRVARRKALSLPVLNVGVALAPEGRDNIIKDACICVAPVAPVPLRMKKAEEILTNGILDEQTIRAASEAAAGAAKPRDSRLRGSADYRVELVRVMTYRTIKNALQAPGGCQIV